MHRVAEAIRHYAVTLTAADLGLTTTLIGTGTLVNLLDFVPPGYQATTTRVRRLGTITNGSGTTVLDVGVTGSGEALISDLDIEGTVGDIDISAEGNVYDFAAGAALTCQVTTATAACSAVAGLRIEFDLRKYASEENA